MAEHLIRSIHDIMPILTHIITPRSLFTKEKNFIHNSSRDDMKFKIIITRGKSKQVHSYRKGKGIHINACLDTIAESWESSALTLKIQLLTGR